MVVSLSLVVIITFSGYTVFGLAMGSPTPLVVVTSGSMEPTLYQGDLLVIQARGENQIAVDDVIVFTVEWHDTPIVHRVIEIIEDDNSRLLFITRGDNNNRNDTGYRTIDDILGVMVLTIPRIGYVSLFLQTLEGKILVIAIFVFLFILSEMYDRLRRPEEATSIHE